jgi:hypothetical protein
MNEFIQAILIMVQFHKMALITESLKIHFCQHIEEEELEHHELKHDPIKKLNLLKTLEIINQEGEESEKRLPRKSCDFSEVDMSDLKQIVEDDKVYTKHIHSFCNVYLDFDPHSEEYRSYLVYF